MPGRTTRRRCCTASALTSPLPQISDQVVIDGYTNGGTPNSAATGTNAVITVRIDGAKLVLTSSAVSSPRHARFAHAADAMANLWNEHGLPPAPFAIDITR